MQSNYSEFLRSKVLVVPSCGQSVEDSDIHPMLYPFQRDLVRWSLRKGRAAIFAGTGLGKTLMQLEWARLTGEPCLILAPLAVSHQTIREAEKLGIDVAYAHDQSEASTRIVVTNYERIEKFDIAHFGAMVADESSILKSFDGKTRTKLIRLFKDTPLRLCCTATPAPNDITEIANHAEFLGIMSRVEMLAAFFVHDQDGWRLKGHACEPFYRWLASWGISLNKPSDLGYEDADFILPPLHVTPQFVETDWKPEGELFATAPKGITERTQVRRHTLEARLNAAVEFVRSCNGSSCIAWVGLNDEGRELAKRLPDAVLVEGADSQEHKTDSLLGFADGTIKTLITKASIAGFGMNFQQASRMVFVGMNDSWESYYQAVRRLWRFGQTEPVEVRIVLSEPERVVYDNVMDKEQAAITMQKELVSHVAEFEKEEISAGMGKRLDYQEQDIAENGWHTMLGDTVERIKEIESGSVGLSIFSPPFGSLYTYSPSERDLGNSLDEDQFWKHFGFITPEILRATMPGRLCCVHCAQLPLTKQTDGVIGMRDFRGDIIRHFSKHGWIYHGEACIDKNPQAQAIRTKNKGLMFVQLHKDSSWSRPAFADYIVIFRKPGENPTAIDTDVDNETWIKWAHPIWYGIRETETLNYREARSDDDERHICPLQLETIERCIRLWSNKGDLVFSPFMGIGSEGYQAIRFGRRFVGIELKPEYFDCAIRNLRDAENKRHEKDLLTGIIDESTES